MLSVTAVLSIIAAKVAQKFSTRACLFLSEVFILPRHKVNQHFCPISAVLFADCLQTDVGDSVYIMGEQNEGTRESFPATVQRSVLNIYVWSISVLWPCSVSVHGEHINNWLDDHWESKSWLQLRARLAHTALKYIQYCSCWNEISLPRSPWVIAKLG